ncbi:unnamed protein product [Oppiella nova]|uniref:Uncharacterized protein n=1 Tax=Oppiella nova TaxID=334625 RepID=A0A7R9QL65_9ACAR|nr:unnamed protein product [Oppiella nova]CAG2168175.1 unnamed protein product [Oppiella nova]
MENIVHQWCSKKDVLFLLYLCLLYSIPGVPTVGNGTYARIYIKRSMQRDRERMKMHQNYGLNGNRPPRSMQRDRERMKMHQNYGLNGNRPPVRVRPQNQWYANG